MPIMTSDTKKALRRLQADKLLNKKQLAELIGVSERTAQHLTRDENDVNVKTTVLNKVLNAIAKNYWPIYIERTWYELLKNGAKKSP